MHRYLICLLLMLSPFLARADAPCGPDAPCAVAGGEYNLRLPEGWDRGGAMPVVVFFHGYRSSGATIFRSSGLGRAFLDQGYVIVGPNGARRANGARAWPARPGGGARDDVAFTLAVLEDVAARLNVDRARIYATGFSAGGSMAWMMGCYAGKRFAGVASVAGALRRPVPEVCPGGPVPLLQIHGFSDRIVPLEGRGVGDWHQGDVFESLALIRAANGCTSRPDDITLREALWCRDWSGCAGAPVKFCLHDGGHGLPQGWAQAARRFFEGR
ncbi:alpha/beta hydrolase family esterase [Oceanibium sediminis]|uniref:alpha/beta hydrolase family esterase n=1 Tax=Oceanibium sediminis TaxID=2026339 RepID=UPI001300B881|nr:PHB depolymerase family esterase [Oceanibium sediminis]